MPYIGNPPAEKYASYDVQHITTSATSSYVLDKNVANENEIRVVLNNVIQQPGSSYAYTASGNTLTLSAATTSSDKLYVVFTGKAVQTVTPPPSSVGLAQFNATGSPGTNTFLRGDNSWATPSDTSLTLNNNAANRVVAGTGTTNTMDAQAGLIFDGSKLGIGTSTMTRTLNITDTTSSASTGIQLIGANNGTQFINFGDTDDSNVGEINYDHSTNKMLFRANDAYEMSLFNGVVGMGANASSADLGNGLHVKVADSGASVNANRSAIVAEGTGDHGITIAGNNAGQGGLWFANQSATDAGQIDYNHPDDTMRFYTGSSERLRIHGGAADVDKVSIGTTSAVGGLHVQYNAGDSTSQGTITVTANNAGTSTGILFLDGQNQNCGRITVKGGDNTSQFYTSSDHRLKQDVAPIDSSLETIKSLQPKKYKWNTNPDSGYHEGFLAHELQALIPDAVDGNHNAVDSEDNPIYQGIDKTAIIPHLTKALQEAITKIETLETENTDIKARLTTLENA